MACRIAVAQTLITPADKGPLAGYSSLGSFAFEDPDPDGLHATALAIAQGDSRLVFIALDLHSCTKLLWDLVGEEVESRAFLSKDRIVLSGTHTHSGPGNFYGNLLYDLTVSPRPGQQTTRARWLAKRIADAAVGALEKLQPGHLRIYRPRVWGVSSNRAMEAFRRNSEYEKRSWFADETSPGFGCAKGLPEEDQYVDPRCTALVAKSKSGGPLQHVEGLIGIFACHATSQGPAVRRYSPDWAGPACRTIRDLLATSNNNNNNIPVGFCAGASGDISPLPLGRHNAAAALLNGTRGKSDETLATTPLIAERRAEAHVGGVSACGDRRPLHAGEALQAAVGERLGSELVEHIRERDNGDGGDNSDAGSSAAEAPLLIGAAHLLWDVGSETSLPSARFGLPTLGGAACGPNPPFYKRFGRGYTSACCFSARHGQRPKAPIPLIGPLIGCVAPRLLPLHAICLGEHMLVTVPGEPTVMAAWRIEQGVCAIKGVSTCSVVGFAGDYCGYWTTPEEYDQQLYEGSSMLYGRRATEILEEKLVVLATQAAVEARRVSVD